MDSRWIRWSIVITAFLSLFTVLLVDTWPVDKARSKRTIIQMCGLISFYTNRSCLDYNNYGCFCGLGNAGRKPLDTVDACCWRHDYCYGLVECFWMYPQLVGYNVHCHQGGCECTDSMENSPCARTTCECDVRFASCLAEGQFHYHYVNYDRVLCAQQPWHDQTEQQVNAQEEHEEQTETTPESLTAPTGEQTETVTEETETSRGDSEGIDSERDGDNSQPVSESETGAEEQVRTPAAGTDNNSRQESEEQDTASEGIDNNSRQESEEQDTASEGIDNNSRQESEEQDTASEGIDNNSRQESEEQDTASEGIDNNSRQESEEQDTASEGIDNNSRQESEEQETASEGIDSNSRQESEEQDTASEGIDNNSRQESEEQDTASEGIDNNSRGNADSERSDNASRREVVQHDHNDNDDGLPVIT